MPKSTTTPVQLLQGDRVDATTDYRDALLVNCSAVFREVLGAKGYMLQQPGLTLFGEGEGRDRGGVWNDQQQTHFRVSGNSLISVSASGTVTVLGTSGVDIIGPRAAMPYSFNNQAIVIDGNYYLYNPTDGVVQVTDPDLGEPYDCTWINGLFVFTDGEFIYHTDLEDETVIDPLKYATSEFAPDRTLGLGTTTDNKLIAFNRFTIEFFANEPNEFFAFTRLESRNINAGIIGTHAKCQIQGQWYFLGGPVEGNVSLYRMGVGVAEPIGSRETDRILQQYTADELFLASMESRIVDNYRYILLMLPNETLMCNLEILEAIGPAQAWSLLTSGSAGPAPYRGVNAVYDARIPAWVVGDIYGPDLGKLDVTVATHYGALMQCAMTSPFIYLETQSIDELNIQTIPGFTGEDDAQVFLSLTYDGWFYSMETLLQYGEPGQYDKRFGARQLGYINNWFSLRFRWLSRSRMAFSFAWVVHS